MCRYKKSKREVYGTPQITVRWRRVRTLVALCLMLHVVGVLGFFALPYVALTMRLFLGRHLDLVADIGEGLVLPVLLAVAGLISGCFHLPQACHLYYITSHQVQKSLNRQLCVALYLNLVWAFLLLVIVVGALVHSYFLPAKVKNGLLTAMASYKNNSKSKITMDILQYRFQCCGCDNHTDWFEIPWFEPQLANL